MMNKKIILFSVVFILTFAAVFSIYVRLSFRSTVPQINMQQDLKTFANVESSSVNDIVLATKSFTDKQQNMLNKEEVGFVFADFTCQIKNCVLQRITINIYSVPVFSFLLAKDSALYTVTHFAIDIPNDFVVVDISQESITTYNLYWNEQLIDINKVIDLSLTYAKNNLNIGNKEFVLTIARQRDAWHVSLSRDLTRKQVPDIRLRIDYLTGVITED